MSIILSPCHLLFSCAEEDLEGKTEEEIEMMKMMGFASFDTTKASRFFSLNFKMFVSATSAVKVASCKQDVQGCLHCAEKLHPESNF